MNNKPDPIIEASTRILTKLTSKNKSVSFVQIAAAFRSYIICLLQENRTEEEIFNIIDSKIKNRLKRCLKDA